METTTTTLTEMVRDDLSRVRESINFLPPHGGRIEPWIESFATFGERGGMLKVNVRHRWHSEGLYNNDYEILDDLFGDLARAISSEIPLEESQVAGVRVTNLDMYRESRVDLIGNVVEYTIYAGVQVFRS